MFSLDLSDDCPIFYIRDTRQKKVPPHIIVKRDFKNCVEQAFLRDLFLSDITNLCAIPDPELALSDFIDVFNSLANKHAPFKKYRVKNRTAPWFSPEMLGQKQEALNLLLIGKILDNKETNCQVKLFY